MTIKVLFSVFWFFLIIFGSKSQTSSESLMGEWLMEISDDGDWYPIIFIFRSDQEYLVFNDLDFVGFLDSPSASDIRMDNDMVTALPERGNWHYDKIENQLILHNRNFVNENSLFNYYYGVDDSLVFFVRNFQNDSLILCTRQDEAYCDKYIKNYRPVKSHDIIYYKERSLKFSGNKNKSIEIPLSGFETEIILEFILEGRENKLILSDKKGREVFYEMISPSVDWQTRKVKIIGVTQLNIDIDQEEGDFGLKLRLFIH